MSIRSNGRPAMLASSMYPNHLALTDRHTRVACPDCGRWRPVKRQLLFPHDGDDGDRCPGSGQEIVLDLTVAEWSARLDEAIRDAERIRAARVHSKPEAPTPPPLCRMARTA